MRETALVCENQILLKHFNSAQCLSAGSGTDYLWDLLWGSLTPDKCQLWLSLVSVWFVFFLSGTQVKTDPSCPGPGLPCVQVRQVSSSEVRSLSESVRSSSAPVESLSKSLPVSGSRQVESDAAPGCQAMLSLPNASCSGGEDTLVNSYRLRLVNLVKQKLNLLIHLPREKEDFILHFPSASNVQPLPGKQGCRRGNLLPFSSFSLCLYLNCCHMVWNIP